MTAQEQYYINGGNNTPYFIFRLVLMPLLPLLDVYKVFNLIDKIKTKKPVLFDLV